MILSILLLVFALTGAHISGGFLGYDWHVNVGRPEGARTEKWFVGQCAVFAVVALLLTGYGLAAFVNWIWWG